MVFETLRLIKGYQMVTIHLGLWGRVLVMCIGASFVMLSVLVALCFLAPGCWGYNYLENRCFPAMDHLHFLSIIFGLVLCGVSSFYSTETSDEQLEEEKKKLNLPTAAKLEKSGHIIVSQIGSTCEVGKKIPLVESRASLCSTLSEVSNKSLSQISEALTEPASAVCTATFSLQYFSNPENTKKDGRLVINVQEVSNLPNKVFPRHTDVYLMVQLQHGSRHTFNFQTKAIRNTRSPQFNQQFEVIAKKDEIKNSLIKISAFERDKYTNPFELAALKMNLKSVRNLTTSLKPITSNTLMDKIHKVCGNVLVGLSYLPTAGRLSVNVARVANLQLGNKLIDRTNLCPWLRIFLLNGESGKTIQRRKSIMMKNSEQSEYTFNEVVTFDVNPSILYTITLLIILCHKTQKNGATQEMKIKPNKTYVTGENNNNNENMTKDTTKQKPTTKTKNEDFILGHVALGNLVAGNKEKKHWNMMVDSPRRLVSLWHSLQ